MSIVRGLAQLVTLGGCLTAVSAAAQPSRTALPPARGPVLSGSIYGGYDAPLFTTTTAPNPTNPTNPTLQPATQSYSGADALIDYTRAGRRVSMSLQANASNRYYPQFTPSSAPSYGASFSLASSARSRWGWSLTQFAHYAPISGTSLFAGAGTNIANSQTVALTSATAFQVSTTRLVDINTSGSLSYSLSRRSNISLTTLVGGIVPIDSQITGVTRLNGRLRIDREISRALRAYVGYGVTQNRVAASNGAPAATYEISGFDFGIDFSRPFQLTRSTTLGFSTGLVRVPEATTQSYQMTGAVTLDYQVRNSSWQATAAATRDARFVQAYRNAVVFLGGSGTVSGRLVGRLGTLMSANYSKGDINTGTGKTGFRSYSAAAQLRLEVRRMVATFIEYSAFRSEIDDTAALAGFPTGAFGRHGVRGGLSFGLSPFVR